jgi:hypothetical protein
MDDGLCIEFAFRMLMQQGAVDVYKQHETERGIRSEDSHGPILVNELD